MSEPIPRRLTAKKCAILQFLNEYDEWTEHGYPPYAAATIARELGMDLSNLTKTLRNMVAEGLVVCESRMAPAWNERAGRSYDRVTSVYWNAATVAVDRIASDAEAARRQEASAKFWAFIQEEVDRVKRGEKPRTLGQAIMAQRVAANG